MKVEPLFSSLSNVVGEEGKRNSAGFVLSRDLKHDDEVLSMEPLVKPKPKIICLDEKTVLAVAKANVYSQIMVLLPFKIHFYLFRRFYNPLIYQLLLNR